MAGTELAEGEPFLMVISDGPLLRELPESTGVPLSQAQTVLVERSLGAETVEQFDEDVPEGTVISWSVPGDATLTAGSLVEPGTTVELIVSSGPEPRTVPDVTGATVDAARTELTALRLELTIASQEFSDDAPLGTIIGQQPEPDTTVERGAEVAITVSRGPDLVLFPDLSTAATYEDAAQILFEAGFEARLVFGDAQGEIRSVRIDGEEPDVGETFKRGTQVDITAL
jgi:serine/threonine-protein kinase